MSDRSPAASPHLQAYAPRHFRASYPERHYIRQTVCLTGHWSVTHIFTSITTSAQALLGFSPTSGACPESIPRVIVGQTTCHRGAVSVRQVWQQHHHICGGAPSVIFMSHGQTEYPSDRQSVRQTGSQQRPHFYRTDSVILTSRSQIDYLSDRWYICRTKVSTASSQLQCRVVLMKLSPTGRQSNCQTDLPAASPHLQGSIALFYRDEVNQTVRQTDRPISRQLCQSVSHMEGARSYFDCSVNNSNITTLHEVGHDPGQLPMDRQCYEWAYDC